MKAILKLHSLVQIRFVCICCVCIALSSCHSKDTAENKNYGMEASNVPTVMVCEAQNTQFQGGITISGSAQPNQEVKVYAMCNGYVKTWKHDIGEFVKRGEVLAILANPQLMQQQAKAQAEYNGDKTIYERLEGVYKKTPELTPLQQVDEA